MKIERMNLRSFSFFLAVRRKLVLPGNVGCDEALCAGPVPVSSCGFLCELRQFRDADVHLRVIVQPMHGRSGMMLSRARLFYGGPPKFRPNPKLFHGFSGEQSKPPVSDPNLRPHGGHRAFMNSLDQETRPTK